MIEDYGNRLTVFDDYSDIESGEINWLNLVKSADGDIIFKTYQNNPDHTGVRIALSGTRFSHEFIKACQDFYKACQREAKRFIK